MAARQTNDVRPGTPRSLLGRLLALILVRAELFSLEVDEHKETMIGHLLVGLIAFAALLLALMAGLLLIAVLTPVGARPLVFGLITGLSLLVGLGAALKLRRRLNRQEPPFALTLREVRKDCQTLLKTGNRNDDTA